MFLAGKPCFHVPVYLEQAILANRLVARGAAMAIEQTQEAEVDGKLSEFFATNPCTSIAAGLAAKYRGFDLDREVATVADEIRQLAV
jgi:UDP:flavonoid glycosyltransferase YjiC (YdhE family)